MANHTFAQNHQERDRERPPVARFERRRSNPYVADDFTKLNPLDRTWAGVPGGARDRRRRSAQSEYEDMATNLREYTWYVMVVTTPDNIPKIRSDLS